MHIRKSLRNAAILAAACLSACAGILAGCVDPQPGAVIYGTIDMPRAESASLSLRISADGRTIEQGWITFKGLTCPPSEAGELACGSGMWSNVSIYRFNCSEFSAGELTALVGVEESIQNGRFDFKSGFAGEISGQFTSPTTAKGQVHLALFGGKMECGRWDWSTR